MSNARFLKKSALYIVFALVLYLVFLVATAPAIWLSEAAARLSNGAFTLTAAQGTFWRGSGELHAGGPATGVRHLGTVRWNVNPLWLFAGRAQLSLQLEGSARAEASMRVGRHEMIVQDLSATLPAQMIAVVYPAAAFFAPTGTIEIRAPSLELNKTGLTGTAETRWQNAGGRFTGANGLGDYRLELTGRGETAAIRLTTLQGMLDLNGEGQWRVTGNGDIQFTGTATAKGDATQLEPLLRAFGRDLGGGRREIRFNGQFPLVQQLGF